MLCDRGESSMQRVKPVRLTSCSMAANTKGLNFFYFFGLLMLTQALLVTGMDVVYPNSYVSPNSAENNIGVELSESPVDVTSGPSEIHISESKVTVTSLISEIAPHSTVNIRMERSPDPILSKPSGIDELLSSKNIADNLDSNDVELSGRIASFIQPSKTIKDNKQLHLQQTAMEVLSIPGEEQGAPHGRSLPLMEPQEISPTATMTPSFATLSPQLGNPRQANPDIQDIITGIVKLLNGNVNVQANTAPALARPSKPVSTRINNRGPPRITDVPPDFNVGPSQLPLPPLGQMPPPISPTKVPTPYPFDIPPQNTSPIRPYVPILEQLHGRPGFHRPVTIPLWSRPNGPPRRPLGPYRRPKPPFKPIPIFTAQDGMRSTSEKPIDEDILTLDLGSELQPSSSADGDVNKGNDGTTNEVVESTTEPMEQIGLTQSDDDKEKQDILNYEKHKEKSSSKMEKHTSKVTPTEIFKEDNVTFSSETSTFSEASSVITPSKVSSEIMQTLENSTILDEAVTTITTPSSSVEVPLVSTPSLESSIEEVMQTLKEELMISSTITTTSTEELPSISSSVVTSIEKFNTSSKEVITSSAIPESQSFPYYPYRPRPGIVLDDTEYKPGGVHRPPILTARPPLGQLGDIFDITVSAIQGPGGTSSGTQGKPHVIAVDLEHLQTADVITSPVGDEGFVSIDGKRTYLNLFGDPTATPSLGVSPVISATPTSTSIIGTGYAIPEPEKPKQPEAINGVSNVKPTPRRPVYGRRPSQPPVRIDTCIVGDDSTCDTSQHEVCKTEAGVSACHCSPGHARRKHRDPCRKIVSMLLSLRVDRLYERRVVWANELGNKGSESYQQLSYETERAMDSAMSMTPFSDEFLGAKVNSIYRGERSAGQAGVFVNITLQLEANADTSRPTVRGDIQRHLLGVIQRRSNNVGNSALWVDSPPGSISNLQDLDECASPELHDCHNLAKCINVFGGFKCECGDGFRDPWADNKHQAGRHCEQCSAQYCNNRGECKYQNGQEVCVCTGNYYGSQCEVDGEILGVAIGASVAAVIIIGLTLVCLVMWSRRWSKEQKTGVTSPVFGYMGGAGSTVKTPVVGGPPYQVSMEDRIRWAQIADVMAQSNHYAPEPVTAPTRPSSAVFGYPNLSLAGTVQRGTFHGTLPPVPMPRLGLQAQLAHRAASVQGMRPLDNSSSSEEEDRADLLGRNFHVPRPKSRSNASIANQSGIYYDVDYEPNEIYKQGSGIPMSTYTIGRPYYRS